MMKKINKLATQFPNIFRFIPESTLFNKVLKSKTSQYFIYGLVVSVCLVLVLFISVLGIKLCYSLTTMAQVINQKQELNTKLNFWQSIASRYDGYKDAYFQIAVLEYKLGDKKNAKQTNLKALLLDPNFENAKKLEALLN